jgi:ADP-heptose:LPS heptosyltransferase
MSQIPLPKNASVCIISARRYGDAIINANFLRAAANARPDIRWTIWTKPEFVPLFELMGFTNIISSEFPIAGGVAKTVRQGGLSLMKAIYQLRKMHLDASIDFIGDSREALLGYLITGSKHHSPKWSNSHWMHKLIWNYQIPNVNYINIASTQDRVYEFIPNLLSNLTGKATKLVTPIAPVNKPVKIAFHVFPSASFRKWPMKNWEVLAELLNNIGIKPIILCSQAEKTQAEQLFKANKSLSITVCSSINNLISEIQKIDVLVGLDSFLIHLAAALGKRTVSLVAGHLPNWWSPDENIPLGQSGGCTAYPCANQAICIGKISESQCIKSIEPKQVMAAINMALSQAALG